MIALSHIAERTQYFAGRHWVFQKINEWLATPHPSRYFLIRGEPGSGKTALAGRLYQFSAGDYSPNGYDLLGRNWISASHFCSASDAISVDPRTFATSIALQLSSRHQAYAQALKDVGDKTINIHVENKITTLEANSQAIGVVINNLDVSRMSAQDAFNRVVIDPLLEIYKAGFKDSLTILVDSLDEAITHTGDVNIVKLLSNLDSLPSPVRFVLTSRRDDRVEGKFTSADGLVLSAAEFDDQNRADILDYVTARLTADAQLSKHLPESEGSFPQTIATKAEGNFQYAAFVLNAIARGQVPKSALEGLPPGLDALYHRSLERAVDLGKKDWARDYAPTMGLLSVAQESLSMSQLRSFTGEPEGSIWTCVMDLQQFIEDLQPNELSDEIRYSLYHRSVIEFLHRRQIKLATKSLNRFYVPASEGHRKVADYYLEKPASEWDDYGLKYVATHLAEAARSSVGSERHRHVESLVRLVVDTQFRAEHMQRLHDLTLLQRDLQLAANVAAQDSEPSGLPCVVEGALALVDFRRKELRPEPLFEHAGAGAVDNAVQRLGLFDVDPEWQQIALATIAWSALPANVPEASALRDRVALMEPSSPRAARLIAFFDTALKSLPSPPRHSLPQPQPLEVAKNIVDRMGGSGADTELLEAHGIPTVRNPSMRAGAGYLSQHDAPFLVSCAVANPSEGMELLRQYIALHTNYHYVVYRNRSLGFLLDSILDHPDDSWVRKMTVELACSALAGSRVDFQGALPLSVLFARAGHDPKAIELVEAARDQQLQVAASLTGGRQADPLATCKRQLGALAEGFQLLGRPADSAVLIDAAMNCPYGFAGFNAPACLTLAEAIEISQAANVSARHRALDDALRAAHNVQDGLFCARVTARTNALRQLWWEKPFDVATTIEQFCQEPDAAGFCPMHLIAEKFVHRGSDGMELPPNLLFAKTIVQVADAFHVPVLQLERVNPNLSPNDSLEPGTAVRIPDAGFASWLAARFAGAALANGTLAPVRRVALVRALAPIAIPNPTALDTVLARLVIASRPASAALEDRIENAAKASIVLRAVIEPALPS